jgi:SAM-dependent methyltransferase
MSVFSNPTVYSAFQNLMGAHQLRKMFVTEYIRPAVNCSILDIGCGPADILEHLPRVNYVGYDISPLYIAKASERFGGQGVFRCQELKNSDIEAMQSVDIVLAMGLLHHLDDDVAVDVMKMASRALKPGGRLLTFDPCIDKGQNFLARFLVTNDRGQNVRTKVGYESLASRVFEAPRVEVRHRAWVPYTHCFMECIRK